MRDFKRINDLLSKVGGWPLIDDNWDPNNYDINNALIEYNKQTIAKNILYIEAISDLINNTQMVMWVMLNMLN